MSEETIEKTEEAPRLRTQKELFTELAAQKHVLYLAELGYENKIREIAEELGNTFKSEGFCDEYPEAPVLQIRTRLNKKKGRDVPFFVPLNALPSTWLGKNVQKREDASEEPEVVVNDEGVIEAAASPEEAAEAVVEVAERNPEDDGIVVE